MAQLTFFPDSLPTRHVPTNITSNRHPIHRWSNFIAGFSPEFVNWCIQENRINGQEGRLLDPFAGLSTSLVQANSEGIRSVGFEPHPFFFDLSSTKINPPSRFELDAIEEMIGAISPFQGNLSEIWGPNALKFLSKLVPNDDLCLLANAVILEDQVPVSNRLLYRLVISRVLGLAASSSTDGIYKAPTTLKRSIPYRAGASDVCREIREDIEREPSFRGASLYQHSSEKMPELANESCSICVTSPPYLNNFDFAEMTRMELYFWRYASSWGEITEKVRRKLLVNTTTAPSDLKNDQESSADRLMRSFRAELAPLVAALHERQKLHAGKKDYWKLVYPYFSKMQTILLEIRRVLRAGSPLHIVIGDAALYGVHIRMDTLIAHLLGGTGFEVHSIETLRTRGDRWILAKRKGSGNPLGEFHIYARRI